MSRKSLDDDQQWLQAGTLNHAPEHADGESEFPNELNNNKCTDWTVYLDDDDHHATERAEQEQHGYLFYFLFLISIIYHSCY